MVYSVLARLLPARPVEIKPQRIVFIRPCCIGDVVMATAALSALRGTFPQAHITWAVGSWSASAVEHHPALDAVLDSGGADMPLRSLAGMLHFVRQLRAGDYDLAVSLLRSPWMSLAVYLSGIPIRAGLDSLGRGFGYNLRLPIDPADRIHESELYLKLISAIAGQEVHAWANLPVTPAAKAAIERRLAAAQLSSPYIVAHPGGGVNPGMQMDSKRYPPARLAELLNHVAGAAAAVILIGGPKEAPLVKAVAEGLDAPAVSWVGALSFQEIAALAAGALFYIGNDTGLTHLAAASGARTAMMMGPTDPKRYAPYTPDHLVLWKPMKLAAGGVAAGGQPGWDWARDGFSVADGAAAILDFLD